MVFVIFSIARIKEEQCSNHFFVSEGKKPVHSITTLSFSLEFMLISAASVKME
jgi:hypothetical protein